MKSFISFIIASFATAILLIQCDKPASQLIVNTWQGDSAGTDSVIPQTTAPASGTMTADQATELFHTTLLQEKLRVAKAQIKGATFQFFTDGSCHMSQMIEHQKAEYFGKYSVSFDGKELQIGIDRIKDVQTGELKSSSHPDTLSFEILALNEHALLLKEILHKSKSGMLGADIPMTLKFVTSEALNSNDSK